MKHPHELNTFCVLETAEDKIIKISLGPVGFCGGSVVVIKCLLLLPLFVLFVCLIIGLVCCIRCPF